MRWAAPALVALITLTAFLPTVQSGFLDWDDWANLVDNHEYRGLGWSNLRWMLTTTLMGHWIPLTWVTFGADYVVWGMDPAGYHLTNLLLHTCAATVFYFVALRLLRATLTAPGEVILQLGAGAAALFFSIHPLRVESVAWATERRDVLSGLWFLLAILLYLDAAGEDGTGRRWRLAGSVGCYALAVGSKAIVMTLPLVLIVMDVYPLRRLAGWWRQPTDSRALRIWAEKIPYLALGLAAAGMATWAVRTIAEPPGARPLAGRIAVALYGLGFYIWKTALPFPLSPLYEIPPQVDPLAPAMVLSGLAVTALTVALFLLRRKWPAGLAVWVTYGVLLAPVSGIIQSGPQIVAERYSYLPCLGLALLVGAALCLLLRATDRGRLGRGWAYSMVAAGLVWFLGLGAVTWQQARVWHDPETLWSYAVSISPESAIAHNNLGAALIRQGRFEEAHPHITTALQMRPVYDDAQTNLAVVLDGLGKPAEAREARAGLGNMFVKYGKLTEAIEVFEKEVQAHPEDARAQNNLGVALFLRGKTATAIEHFGQALKINPGFDEARRNLDAARMKP